MHPPTSGDGSDVSDDNGGDGGDGGGNNDDDDHLECCQALTEG